MSDLQNLSLLTFPRQYVSLRQGKTELHLFSDASLYAMGACVYLRKINCSLIESALVVGKSRLFPQTQVQKFSIARKELIALCMGIDLLSQCRESLKICIDNVYVWVDSMTVIKWCQCDNKQLSQFVRNRVDKILTATRGEIPKYIDTKNNPANVASRGMTLKRDKECLMWTKGPPFLLQPTKSWEMGPNNLKASDDVDALKEIKRSVARLNHLQVTAVHHTLKNLSDSSTSTEAENRLIKLHKCFNALRKNPKTPSEIASCKNQVNIRKQTRMTLIKMAQAECLGKVINEMRINNATFEQAVLKDSPKERPRELIQMIKYIPFLDDNGILRIGGRLQNSEFDFHFKHPVILPHRHWTTKLYIKGQHVKCGHLGPDLVFGSLQHDVGLWPVGGIVTVRHYLRECLGCKLRLQVRGKQLMAPLPASRLKPRTHVFTYAASDLAGPFSVVVGRSTVKRWLCVFVCMVTTAVRIEVAADLSTSSFINAFRRFLCSTGFRTRFIRTDNGTNFVGANNVLKKEALKLIQSSSVWQAKMDEWEVEWDFGPPEASHHGGIYERQIRTIRKAIDGITDVSSRKPTDDEFLTCCKMAEYIMNCRPLTKSVSDDGLPPLRPIDLMIGVLEPRNDCHPPSLSSPRDEFRHGYRFTKKISELWWERWCRIYVSSLQERKKWKQTERDFQIGDLVILCNEPTPRFLKYPYAIIREIRRGSDGHVRSVIARMADGKLKERDVTKIALIDPVHSNVEGGKEELP